MKAALGKLRAMPVTVKVPLMVVALMVAVSAIRIVSKIRRT